MGHKFSVLRKIRFFLFYYKKITQHVFIDGQLINKQLLEKDYVIKEQPLR